jgi:DNA-binding SARP family transcriptional activator/TolB-like protein
MIELRAFGPVDLAGDGGDLASVLAQPKRLALLAYLVMARPRGYHRRDTLLNLFWPELDQTRGRKALSQSLFFLRRALPEGAVLSRGTEEVGVDFAQIHSDVTTFEEALEERRWQDALDLYRGEFLKGLHLTGAPDFQRWMDTERERLRELAAGAAWSLARERIDAGELVAAERAAQRALLLVPTEESPVRQFVRALAEAGDRAAALRFYEKFRGLLAEELDVEPAPETAALPAALRAGDLDAAASEAADLDAAAMAAGRAETRTTPREVEVVSAQDHSRRLPRDAPGPLNAFPTEAPGPLHGFPAGAPRRRRWSPIAVGAATVALVGLTLLSRPFVPSRTPEVPYRIAVIPFENRTGDPSLDELGVVAADWITEGLTRIDTLQVVSPPTILEILADEAADDSQVERVARSTGAGLVVTGSYAFRGDSLEVRAQLLDPVGNRILEYFEAARTERSAPAAALGPMGRQITGRVALSLDERVTGLASVKDPDPPDYETYLAYLNGVDLFFDERYPEAIRELDRAWAADSSFVAPGIWVASAYGNQGQLARQDSVLDLLEPHRAELPPVQRAGLDIMRAQLRGDNATIYRIASQGLRKSPTTEGRLFTGCYGYHTNRLREAVRALQSEPEGGATRNRAMSFHQCLTNALHALEEHEAELDAAREACQRFPDRIEPTFLESRALVALGRVAEARRVLQDGMTVSSAGWSPGYLQIQVGLELRRHGYPEEGEETIRSGLRGVEDAPFHADHRYTSARARLWLGEYDAAVELFCELAQESPSSLDYTGYLGLALAATGRTDEAREVDKRLEVWSEPYLHGRHLYWRAAIAAHLGDRKGAVTLLRIALAQGVTNSSLRENEDLRPLWNYPPFQALLEPRG